MQQLRRKLSVSVSSYNSDRFPVVSLKATRPVADPQCDFRKGARREIMIKKNSNESTFTTSEFIRGSWDQI